MPKSRTLAYLVRARASLFLFVLFHVSGKPRGVTRSPHRVHVQIFFNHQTMKRRRTNYKDNSRSFRRCLHSLFGAGDGARRDQRANGLRVQPRFHRHGGEPLRDPRPKDMQDHGPSTAGFHERPACCANKFRGPRERASVDTAVHTFTRTKENIMKKRH